MTGEWIDGPPPRIRGRLIAPGTLIENWRGEVMLVGHINPDQGSCSCCSWSVEDEQIARHRIVWTGSPDEWSTPVLTGPPEEPSC